MKAVKISDTECNFLKDDGTYLLDEHVYNCWEFNNGFGRVKYKDLTYNYINCEGKKLFKNNILSCFIFYDGFLKIYINYILYYVDIECNFYDVNYISFKELYKLYPQKRQELIEIIDKYTFHNVDEYFI